MENVISDISAWRLVASSDIFQVPLLMRQPRRRVFKVIKWSEVKVYTGHKLVLLKDTCGIASSICTLSWYGVHRGVMVSFWHRNKVGSRFDQPSLESKQEPRLGIGGWQLPSYEMGGQPLTTFPSVCRYHDEALVHAHLPAGWTSHALLVLYFLPETAYPPIFLFFSS